MHPRVVRLDDGHPLDRRRIQQPHTVDLADGKTFFTHKGAIAHDDLIGSPEGVIVHTDKDVPYLALRPLLSDFTVAPWSLSTMSAGVPAGASRPHHEVMSMSR